MRAIAAIAALLSVATPIAARADGVPASGNAQVDALVGDIQRGNRDAAIGRISEIDTLSGTSRLASTATEFVDRLLRCTAVSVKPTAMQSMVNITWNCPSGKYVSAIDWEFNKPYLIVAEFQDEATMEAARRRPLTMPPPPLITGPTKKVAPLTADLAVLNAFASSVVDGSYTAKSNLVSPRARVSLGYRDVAAHVTVVELDGNGPAALIAQTQGAYERTGHPVAVSCEAKEYLGFCRFSFKSPDSLLIAMVSTRDGEISSLQYIYMTRAQALKIMGKSN